MNWFRSFITKNYRIFHIFIVFYIKKQIQTIINNTDELLIVFVNAAITDIKAELYVHTKQNVSFAV